MWLPTPLEAVEAASSAYTSFIPSGSAASIYSPGKGHKGITPEGWSSLIGIVTAIVGNLLISVALNTQRYAHTRLNQEREEAKKRRRREEQTNGNGVQQPRRRDESTLKKRHTDGDGLLRRTSDSTLDGPQETDALLPRHVGDDNDLSASQLSAKERRSSDAGQKSYLKSPLWWLGLVLMTIGETGNFLAYGFAPASIVSPLGVVALISNCIIAPFVLKERFRVRDGIGVLIAIGGAVTVVVSAKSENPKLGPDKIWHLIATWEFETYLGITSFLIAALMVASEKFGDRSIFIDLGLVGLFGGCLRSLQAANH
jgi:hypothetical protein